MHDGRSISFKQLQLRAAAGQRAGNTTDHLERACVLCYGTPARSHCNDHRKPHGEMFTSARQSLMIILSLCVVNELMAKSSVWVQLSTWR